MQKNKNYFDPKGMRIATVICIIFWFLVVLLISSCKVSETTLMPEGRALVVNGSSVLVVFPDQSGKDAAAALFYLPHIKEGDKLKLEKQ